MKIQEIRGGKLTPEQLRAGQAVVIARVGSAFLVIMLVIQVTRQWVVCYGPAADLSLVMRRRPGGALVDDSGLELSIYERAA